MSTEHLTIDRWDRKSLYSSLFPDYEDDPYLVTNQIGITLRDRLAEAQNWRCCYCGVAMNRWRKATTLCTIEHVIPASSGGRVCWETCAAACYKCNQAGGVSLYAEWMLPLTVPLCPWCGSDGIRLVGRRIIRCGACSRQFSIETASAMPFISVPFGAMRRAAGEMIVANADVRQVANRIGRKILRLDFSPQVLAETLMRLSAPVIATARLRSDDLIAIYDETVAELKKLYTPKTPTAPEREPLAIGCEKVKRCKHLISAPDQIKLLVSA